MNPPYAVYVDGQSVYRARTLESACIFVLGWFLADAESEYSYFSLTHHGAPVAPLPWLVIRMDDVIRFRRAERVKERAAYSE